MPRTASIKGRHISYNADGELCMTVVDPVTRKLLIPTQYIFETRAQQRGTLPSLCQLFLAGRCRKGQGCYQLHADWEAVQRLRSQVDSLPCCCPTHGDKDHIGVLDNALLRESISLTHPHSQHHANDDQSSADAAAAAESTIGANDVVLYVPGCSFFEGSYAPLDRVSYTVGLRRLLEEQRVVLAPPDTRISLLNQATGFPEEKIVADASTATVCRLHAMGRCRYAEECKFLHLCKDLTAADPQLTASPATGIAIGNGDCAAPGSFETSTTSAGLTNGTESSAASCERRLKGSHYHGGSGASIVPGGAPVRQSVFSSMSLQHQQQLPLGSGGAVTADAAGVGAMVKVGSASSLQPSYSMSYHQDPSIMITTNGSTGSTHCSSRPLLIGSGGAADGARLLVPQREDGSNGIDGAGCPSSASCLSKSFSGCRVGPAGATPLPQRVLQLESGITPHVMNASNTSFPGNGQQSSASSATPYGLSAAKGNRVRVSLSLPAIRSTSALTLGGAPVTSNSSEKTNSPPAEESLGISTTGPNSFPRSAAQIQPSSNPTRWHHNPYLVSWPKTEAPHGCVGRSSSLRCHPAGFYARPIARAA
ncbi:hypothetical protein LSCM1_02917 [Leishmania martiniquensis]|uniref:C3H1-type domain-containing protein n=1 Tax=Leishmania martiniquensis TaxID=1580590 RepID=A0A836H7L4_9TRYP|nr:hypothetical protein LSCM1_02917 [Leishmania martiniquensis]